MNDKLFRLCSTKGYLSLHITEIITTLSFGSLTPCSKGTYMLPLPVSEVCNVVLQLVLDFP